MAPAAMQSSARSLDAALNVGAVQKSVCAGAGAMGTGPCSESELDSCARVLAHVPWEKDRVCVCV